MNDAAAPEISQFVPGWSTSIFGSFTSVPWEATSGAEDMISSQVAQLGSDYRIESGIAVHETATVERSAVLKRPIIIGANAFIAANSYLRGGVFIDAGCIVGPSCELKTTFMFSGSKVAHLSFVGDSIIGSRANIEAGATVANYRNECEDKIIRIRWNNDILKTGVHKFGALIGDDTKIGANAVVAPGALLKKRTIVPRLSLIDQSPAMCN